jgi:hypothetical protein
MAMHLTRPLQFSEARQVPRTSGFLRAGDGQRSQDWLWCCETMVCKKLDPTKIYSYVLNDFLFTS